ncbi:Cof-type HAD-IIB family hydrolase [Fictibacillus terranigra]|uniref:Cof-type HAD-IIB family hydrolase n=1 Tax=Fictibacillus terranigra TaxID=3058424 RepID=A0ABT8E3E6_9BACL|nr:Cof-type HAD-IIB family hydrolase [Fictibacillus sp. CENA-BCM004]MDN4072420.1 Cof-type HAD-IIB family hydrolase [Fictibacillus sp. CENA-BCM004]
MKLIAIDLDGTLLMREGFISSENARAIKEAQAQGNIVAICTGRAVEDVLNLLEKAGLECPVIGANGAVLYDEGEIVQAYPLQKEPAFNILTQLEEMNVFYHLHTNKGIYTPNFGEKGVQVEIDMVKSANPEINSEELWKAAQGYLVQFGQVPISSFRDIWTDDLAINKILPFSYSLDKLGEIRKSALAYTGLSITSSAEHNLEINHEMANKGNGLKGMADHFSIPYQDTVAIGDNLNDWPMMKFAGTSIAMGNALPEIKEICHFTTLENDQHGVAHAIREFILKQAV